MATVTAEKIKDQRKAAHREAWAKVEEIDCRTWEQDDELQKKFEFEDTRCAACETIIGGYLHVDMDDGYGGIDRPRFDTFFLDGDRPLCEDCASEVVFPDYHPGTLLVWTWGYEQTNVQFFECLERKTRKDGSIWLKLVEIGKTATETGYAQYEARPVTSSIIGKPMWRKLHVFDGEESGLAMVPWSGGGWCRAWHGDSVAGSSWA